MQLIHKHWVRIPGAALAMAKLPKQKADDVWLERVDDLQQRFNEHIGGNLHKYVDSVCTKFMERKNLNFLADHTAILTKFQDSLYDYQNEILNISGTGPGWKKADSVVQDVRCALQWVEEIYCSALVDLEEVGIQYTKLQFLFQSNKI